MFKQFIINKIISYIFIECSAFMYIIPEEIVKKFKENKEKKKISKYKIFFEDLVIEPS